MEISTVSSVDYSTNVRFKDLVRFVQMRAYATILRFLPDTSKIRHLEKLFTPPRYKVSARQKAMLADARSFTVTAARQTIQGWEWGQGPAILLVHGWGGVGIQLMDFIEPLRAAGFRVITYDNPSHGQSTGERTNIAEFVETVRAVAATIPDLAAVIGHSAGAAAALNLAHLNKLNVPLALIAPAVRLREGVYASATKAGFPKPIVDLVIASIEKETGYQLDNIQVERIAPMVRNKTLICHDLSDPVTPFRGAEHVADLLPHGQLLTTADFGHNRILRNPAVVNAVVAFVSQVNEDSMVG